MNDRPGVTLVALDFDGTIAPIRDDPAAVEIDPMAAEMLNELGEAPGIVVALASGRDVDDLASRIDGVAAYLIGAHGLDIRGPYGRSIRESPPLSARVPDDLRQAATANGFRFEQKRHGVTLHWRGLPVGGNDPIIESFRSWARQHDLKLIEGRSVVEARIPGGGKLEALRWVMSAAAATRLVYAGDDLTDFPALQFAAQNGIGLFIDNGEQQPPPGVTIVRSRDELMDKIRQAVLL